MKLILGDCQEKLKDLADNSVDSVVTDPPYGISFMNRKWDCNVPSVDVWKECLRVLKPGGYLLAFAGTRTQHRMAVNIEDAGFEIRDMIAWVYGSGFPKSHNISKVIDKKLGTYKKGEISPNNRNSGKSPSGCYGEGVQHKTIDVPQSFLAKKHRGFGTNVKPAFEPITVAQKPKSEKTIAENVLKWGTGAINIDGCRIGKEKRINRGGRTGKNPYQSNDSNLNGKNNIKSEVQGRWPANFIHDGSKEVLDLLPITKSGKVKTNKEAYKSESNTNFIQGQSNSSNQHGDSGSAARFFYCAKASKEDRNEGCDDIEAIEREVRGNNQATRVCTVCGKTDNGINDHKNCKGEFIYKQCEPIKNNHPTLKPTKLMQHLVKLVTPPKGIVLDPFMGSGSTGKACVLENFDFIGIEQDENYIEIARARIDYVEKEKLQDLF